jgi:hypothetical protein
MKKTYLLLLCFIICAFTACKSKKDMTQVHIIANYARAEQDKVELGKISLAGAQRVSSAHSFRVDAPCSLSIQVDGKTQVLEIADAGVYLLNLAPDTLLSIPMEYYQASTMPGLDRRTQAMIDSMQESAHKQQSSPEAITILPTQIKKLSANTHAEVYAFEAPPRELEKKRGDDHPEFYQVQTQAYWNRVLINELREAMREQE